ncbi:non-ribosomal peptide synthetase [Pseudoalteromonas sp. PPB1]|uniref:non-ribosomal peptide synthetase n=1 Tax=Pseudoalteromonas sp. PPB1 TaxID=2756136 RepID=UPI001891B21E|nr:non-ribosomal peptide synthetase [Pseudoalteromonas sp. PPB1]
MIAKQIIDEAIASDILLFTEAGKLGFKQKSAAPFPEALKKQIQAHKADIIAFLANQHNDLDIPQRPADKTRLPLSNAQQRLWFIDSLKQGSAEYNQPLAFTVSGQPDLTKIEAVLNVIVERHEILRTTYHQDDTGAYQQVNISQPCRVKVHDLSQVDNWPSQIAEVIATESAKCFDLSADLMLRVDYFKAPATEETSGVLLFNTHHIASDGWSQQILLREFVTVYEQLNVGQSAELAPLEIQYGDFALWQQQRAENGALDDALSYWQQQLDDAPLVHDLPLCQTRPATKQHAGGHVQGRLASKVAQPLLALALRLQVTPFMLMHALLSLLLSRYSNSTDIVIGTPVANRISPQLDKLIGFFVNTLPLRVDTDQQNLHELVAHVKEVHLAAQQHQQVQFDQLIEHLNIPRSAQYAPLCQIMLTTASEFGINQNRDMLASALASDGLALAPFGVERVVARFDIDMHINISDGGVELDWLYDSSIFSNTFITRLNQNFAALLCQVSAQGEADLPLGDISALCESERQQLVSTGEQQRLEYDTSRCIHALFEQQVEAAPEATALLFQNQSISYAELNQRANQLAHYLLSEQQITPETLIGVCSSRSVEMMVSMLAILKAGGAYVPLDPDYPASRLSYMAADAGLKQVIGYGSGLAVAQSLMSEQAGTAIDIAALTLDDYPQHNPALDEICNDSLAYVIYTSGSTGQPKGVQLIHQGAVNLAHNQQARFATCADSKVLQFASISFDAATWEWLMALIPGGTLVIADELQRTDVQQLSELLKTQQITHATLPPALLSTMTLQTDLALQCLIVAGEACEENVVARWRAHYPFYNAYGPSETSVCATVGEIIDDTIHIGTPLCNVQTYVLDQQQNLLPHRSLGELYVGGDGLARGYLGQPELTAERFIENPFYDPEVAGSSKRLYRTGDLVRYLADGNLAFVGRADDQIKIRGFRVELGEIAQQLSRQTQVDSALVLAKNGPAGTYLVAYVQPVETIAEQAQPEFMAQTLATLAQTLPDYMVPKLGVVIDDWPLTANGKVNKKALPEADTSALQGTYVAPQGEREQLIVTLCGELLAQPAEQLSVTANFFTLGGHSLLLMQLASRLRQQGFEVDAQALFAAQSLQEMAQGLSRATTGDTDESRSLIPAGCTAITPDMVPLASLSQAELNDIATEIPGGMANIQDIYPLAPLQEGVLFVHSMDPDNDPYVTNYLYELKSDAALTQFTDSLNFLLARHDVLRTAILWQGKRQALQVVQRTVTLPVTQLACAGGMSAQQTITALADGPQWLDLAQAPLLRLQVCQDPDTGYHYALLQAHHLIIDHVAMAVIQDELHSYSAGKAQSLPAPASYRQFISDTLARMETLDIEGFFSESLGHISEPTLPFGLQDTQGNGDTIREHKVALSDALSKAIRAYAKQHEVSPAAIFHAAWALVLGACSNQQEVVFGTVMSGRMNGGAGVERLLGMLINTLPVAVELRGSSVTDLIKDVDKRLKALLPYEQVSLAQAQKHSAVGSDGPLFSAMLNYRHTERDEADTPAKDSDIQGLSAQERTNYPFNLSVNDYGAAHVFSLDLQIDEQVEISRIAEYVMTALSKLTEATQTQPVSELSVLPADEVARLLTQGQRSLGYDDTACIHHLFEQQAEAAPEATALVFQDQSISYAELNKRANQLAHYLLSEQQITPETLIGVCSSRSMEMMVSMLAILKAGGAYVPLDPDYPASRLSYMAADAGLRQVIGFGSGLAVAQSLMSEQAGTAIDIAALALDDYPQHNPALDEISSDSLAYVIYTSGSTGQPKGVQLIHQGAVNLAHNQQARFATCADSKVLQFASISFDAATWEWLMALIPGGTLVIADESQRTDVQQLSELLKMQQITHATLPPALLSTMTLQTDLALQCLIVAGEACEENVVARWRAHYPFYNAYGPSETSVCATVGEIIDGTIHIGTPLCNVQTYVLDQKQTLLPHGSLGELYVGGDGLARGYLGQPEMTAERFIDNPFYDPEVAGSSKRLYRTGDLVRYLTDGNLAFVGRADDQIKIRGFRVELGEIAQRLSQLTDIDSAVVVAKKGASGNDLVAYIQPAEVVTTEDQSDFIGATLAQLAAQVPEYMVPKLAVVIDEWPLTANGKINKKALPEPDKALLQNAYCAPRNNTEATLCDIWQDLLGIEQVGIQDNFFTLGGDSIIAIQMVGRARQQGLHLNVKQLFATPSIATLSEHVEFSTRINAQQDAVTGEMPLLPIQQRFFAANRAAPSHYNQSLLLSAPGNLTGHFSELVNALVERHDALRLRFAEVASFVPLCDTQVANMHQIVDLSELDEADFSAEVERRCDALQRQLDIEKGPLCKFVYFYAGDDKPARLFMTIHHLVVDGVSWRILLQDLETALQAIETAQPIQLAEKTSSYQAWGEAVNALAQSEALSEQQTYWRDRLSLFPAQPSVKVAAEQWHNVSFSLDESDTRILLADCQQVFHSNVDTLMLSAFLLAYQNTFDRPLLRVDMESHGREEAVFDGLDVTQTMGWFTNLYPLILGGQQDDLIATVKSVKQTLQQLPMHGLGYGLLKYIRQDAEICALDKRSVDQAIVFNYLGKLDNVTGTQGRLAMAQESRGAESAPEAADLHHLMVNGQSQDNQLRFDLSFAMPSYSEAQIEALSVRFKAVLLQLVAKAKAGAECQTLIVEDFPAATLEQAHLDSLQSQYSDIERVYVATPMQQGMIYHDLLQQDASLYTTLTHFELDGEVDTPAMQQAWQNVIARHAILRTSFSVFDDADIHQVVHNNALIEMEVLDWQHKSAELLATQLSELHHAIKAKGFDFNLAPLMSLTLVRLPAQKAQLIWSHHHVLTDGWCQATLFSEVLGYYQSLTGGQPLTLPPAANYEDYIQWLCNQNRDDARAFWDAELAGVSAPTTLQLPAAASDVPCYDEIKWSCDETLTRQLSQFAQNQQVTANAVLQLVWAYTLHRYSAQSDVCFGTTLSGRPPEVANVEQMIGLFINTVPVRVQLDHQASIGAQLQQMHKAHSQREQHSYLPLPEILSCGGHGIQGAMFDSLFVFENFPADLHDTGSQAQHSGASQLQVNSAASIEYTNYPVAMTASMQGVLSLRLSFHGHQYERADMEGLLGHFNTALRNLIALDATASLGEMEIMQPQEQQALLAAPKMAYADAQLHSVIAQFDHHARVTPERPALVMDNRTVSYAELDKMATTLAAQLVHEYGIQQRDLIGLCVERSIDTVVGILAILKAGGAYVPLDPNSPAERLNYIINDAHIALCLAQPQCAAALDEAQCQVVSLDGKALLSQDHGLTLVLPEVLLSDPAYVIYTSGSTGAPKGVVQTHRNMARLFASAAEDFSFSNQDTWCLFHSYAFDFSVWEIWGALIHGGKLLIPTHHQTRDTAAFVELCQQHQLSVLNQTPSAFGVFAEHVVAHDISLPALRYVVFGGEALQTQHLQSWCQHPANAQAELINMYGITETTVHVTFAPIARQEIDQIHIGRPLADQAVYILDAQLQPVPVGVAGEMYVTGAGLADGYLGREALSAERFIDNPHCVGMGCEKLYKTGDLGRHQRDGRIQFIGRMDDQVQIRGFRIELGEVTHQLSSITHVDSAVVIARQSQGTQVLHAYLKLEHSVDEQQHTQEIERIKRAAAAFLPAYMVPEQMTLMQDWPLTVNGKIDKKALPQPGEGVSGSKQVAPSTETECQLRDIWAELLDYDGARISVNQSFFELGGHSLSLMKLVQRLHQAFNVSVSIKEAIEHAQIDQLAQLLDKKILDLQLSEINEAELDEVEF